MPTRPRQHQLEELSRRAFEAALPPVWLHRRLDPDYGLDETVDIFDEEERATGLSFHAQLKATDEPELAVALGSVRFSREKADYYTSLALPVLIVLFHAPTERLFVRWFHAYNPHVAIRGDSAPPRKTVRFQFSEADEWKHATSVELEAGVRAFNVFRSPELPLPLRFSLSTDSVPGQDPYRHVFALRAVLKPVAGLVAVDAGTPAAGQPFITLSPIGSVVSLADVASVTLDHDAAALDDPSSHAADIAVLIATVLARVGQSNLAAQIGAATAVTSRGILDFEVAFTLAGAMTRSRRVLEALHLSDALDERGQGDRPEEDARIAASIIQTAVLAHDDGLSAEERRLAVEVGERTLKRAEQRGDRAAAGAASYNLAMLHKSGREADLAIAAFRRAAELDPTYLERPYFHSDFAGVLFESGASADAAEHYGQALAGGEEGLGRALYADALLFSGRYAEAQEQLDRYVEADLGPAGAEWRLKQRVLPRIRATGGDTQEREPEEAEALAERVAFTGASGELSVEEAEELITSALELDACCAEAWFRRALLELGTSGDPGTALESAIISAVLHRYAIGAWRNAVRLAREAGESEQLVADLLRTGYRFNGEDFVDQLTEAVSQGDESSDMLPILDAAMNEVDEAGRRAGFIMRIPGTGGEMTEFAFEPEP